MREVPVQRVGYLRPIEALKQPANDLGLVLGQGGPEREGPLKAIRPSRRQVHLKDATTLLDGLDQSLGGGYDSS